MGSIFVSYSHCDQDFARQLYRELKDLAQPIWMDQFDIHPGQHWDRTIDQALKDSSVLLVIHTAASHGSDNVWDEWAFFRTRRKPIIPLIVEDVELPYRLERLQYIDFVTQPFEQAIKQLIEAISQYDLDPTPGGSGGSVDGSHPPQVDKKAVKRHAKLGSEIRVGKDRDNLACDQTGEAKILPITPTDTPIETPTTPYILVVAYSHNECGIHLESVSLWLGNKMLYRPREEGQDTIVGDFYNMDATTDYSNTEPEPYDRYDAAGYLTNTANTYKGAFFGGEFDRPIIVIVEQMNNPGDEFTPLKYLSKQRIRSYLED